MMILTEDFKNVTILLPVINETYSLTKTVDVIFNTCNIEDLAEFIIIICDRTTNDSRHAAQNLVEKYTAKIRIYIHNQTLPFVGGAIREGFDLALGSHVVLMSSDLETDPHIISQFIEYAKENANSIITASRWKRGGGFEKYNKVKLVCNLIFERVIGVFYLSGLSDLTYAFRIFPTKLVQQIKWEELKHPFFLETALKPIRLGIPFIEIPAHWIARTEGTSVNAFWDNFKYFTTAWHNRFLSKEKILRQEYIQM